MPLSIFPSFFLYCFVSCITPGPANLCSLSAAIRFGTGAALRQLRGLAAGLLIDSLAAALITCLLGNALGPYVGSLVWVGAVYILWLAWKTLRSAGSAPEEIDRQPGFRTGLLINLANVKGLLFCITSLSSFVLPYTNSLGWLLGAGLFLALSGPACNLIWIFAGAKLKLLFSNYRRTVDIAMAIALALCAVSLILPR